MVLAEKKYNPTPSVDSSFRKKKRYQQSNKKGTTKLRALTIFLVLLGFAVGIGLTAQYAKITSAGYEVLKLKDEIAQLETSNQRLHLQIAQLQSLERVESIAVNELGMVPADRKDYKFLASNSSNNYDVGNMTTKGSESTPKTTIVFEKERYELNPFIQVIAQIFAK
ncbi:cell division protein FtsL [Desulfitispora alkaliphila]|uniref:hypothetical protein n=1 Tax=Desulfitispora alkaliphila TaxID=622674 RepID=UPI003D1CBD55